MDQSETKTDQAKVKAAHRYEVVQTRAGLNVAGKKFHFIGAGGIGMSGLAQLLMRNGAIVTGSDQTNTSITEQLCRSGFDIRIGHSRDNLDLETDAVIISAAIKQDNPELTLAHQQGHRVYKYAQMLGLLMDSYEGVAVAGTHGKSTTTGWLSYLLRRAGMDVSFIVGAEVTQLGSSSGVGESKFFIAEACEYDRSFLNLRPKIACILNIEQDHLDYYKTEEQILQAFLDFAQGIKPDGLIIANGQDVNTRKIINQFSLEFPCQTFGDDPNCTFYAQNIQLHDGLYSFDVYKEKQLHGSTTIGLPGRHNIMNALAVIAIASNIGIPVSQIIRLLPSFAGIDRRLMLKDRFEGITILDDYAHHPTEIKATLKAIRQRYEPKRIWCIFQPHQYSRTRFLLDDFAESFRLADVTIVPEIYFVRDSEQSKKEINSQILVEKIRAKGSDASFIDNFGGICDQLEENVTSGDLVITMGAGDVWKIADEYIQRLRKNS